jgi:hypothetical protein
VAIGYVGPVARRPRGCVGRAPARAFTARRDAVIARVGGRVVASAQARRSGADDRSDRPIERAGRRGLRPRRQRARWRAGAAMSSRRLAGGWVPTGARRSLGGAPGAVVTVGRRPAAGAAAAGAAATARVRRPASHRGMGWRPRLAVARPVSRTTAQAGSDTKPNYPVRRGPTRAAWPASVSDAELQQMTGRLAAFLDRRPGPCGFTPLLPTAPQGAVGVGAMDEPRAIPRMGRVSEPLSPRSVSGVEKLRGYFLPRFLPRRRFWGGRSISPSAVLLIGTLGAWAHPAPETVRGSKNKQPSGQANGACRAAPTRQLRTTSPDAMVRAT